MRFTEHKINHFEVNDTVAFTISCNRPQTLSSPRKEILYLFIPPSP